MRILVVDDESDNAHTQALLLRMSGYDTHVCLHGGDALEMVERLRPNVILLDLGMPGMSGFDIAEELRLHPDLRPRLLIALTGYGDVPTQAKTTAAGFDAHFVKPVAWPDLKAVLDGISTMPNLDS